MLLFSPAGCHIHDSSSSQKTDLPPLTPTMDAVQLDIVYVERDREDPLLSSLVWQEIDEVGTVDLLTRSMLREHGFRIGLVGMTPPRSLQRLLGFETDLTHAAGTSRHKELIGRKTFLPSGSTTSIRTGLTIPSFELQLPGQSKKQTFEMAHGVLKTEIERLQDGWVRLHITPEIHHGASKLRPVAGETEFKYQAGQEVEQIRDLSFSVTLNVGEMLVISAGDDAKGKLAERFFINQDGVDRRFMVAIRLSDMKKIEPLYED